MKKRGEAGEKGRQRRGEPQPNLRPPMSVTPWPRGGIYLKAKIIMLWCFSRKEWGICHPIRKYNKSNPPLQITLNFMEFLEYSWYVYMYYLISHNNLASHFSSPLYRWENRYREAQQATQENSSRGWQLMIQGLPNLGGATVVSLMWFRGESLEERRWSSESIFTIWFWKVSAPSRALFRFPCACECLCTLGHQLRKKSRVTIPRPLAWVQVSGI